MDNFDISTKKSLFNPIVVNVDTDEGKKSYTLGMVTEELINKIRYYLKHENERFEVAKEGFEAVTKQGHTFLSRCKQLVSTVEEL